LQFEARPGKQFKTPCLAKTHHKNRAGGVAQGEGPEFKLQYSYKTKTKTKTKTNQVNF
jgi:hypothetical protein